MIQFVEAHPLDGETIALHEASHAVVFLRWLGPGERRLESVSIEEGHGWTRAGVLTVEQVDALRDGDADTETTSTYRAAMAMAWAGPVNEQRRGRADWDEWTGQDLRLVRDLAALSGFDARSLLPDVVKLLDEHEDAIVRLAMKLRVWREMTGDEVRAVVDG